jgi:hypothetical protein
LPGTVATQRKLTERHRFGVQPPREARLRNPLEHAARRLSFLFGFCKQSVDYLIASS